MSRLCLFAMRAAVLVTALSLCAGVAATQADNAGAAAPLGPPVADTSLYTHFLLNEAEGRLGDGSVPFRWDAEAWSGTDRNRLWFKSEGLAGDGRVTDADHELLYDRPITSFFDLQAGMRYDLGGGLGRAWAAFGIEGLAPYLIETSATLYVSDEGHVAGKLLGSYDELLTQRLILEPRLELNLYSRADPARDVGAGVSDIEAGVRLRYEIYRQLAPYVGAVYQRNCGAESSRDALETGRSGAWRLAAGFRVWF